MNTNIDHPRTWRRLPVMVALALAVLAAGLVTAMPRADAITGYFEPVPGCVQPGVDVRAPYNKAPNAGECPSVMQPVTFVGYSNGTDPVLPVCIKPSTDFRSPYNKGTLDGQCPGGYELEYLLIAYNPWIPYEPVCVKPSTDVRSPYNKGPLDGQCPSGYDWVPLALWNPI